ncbi:MULTISPECIES: hypothetical protein [Kitasatospora]|nr:hypothetical protein [Kitasatospora sp. NRRL B-11411]
MEDQQMTALALREKVRAYNRRAELARSRPRPARETGPDEAPPPHSGGRPADRGEQPGPKLPAPPHTR